MSQISPRGWGKGCPKSPQHPSHPKRGGLSPCVTTHPPSAQVSVRGGAGHDAAGWHLPLGNTGTRVSGRGGPRVVGTPQCNLGTPISDGTGSSSPAWGTRSKGDQGQLAWAPHGDSYGHPVVSQCDDKGGDPKSRGHLLTLEYEQGCPHTVIWDSDTWVGQGWPHVTLWGRACKGVTGQSRPVSPD